MMWLIRWLNKSTTTLNFTFHLLDRYIYIYIEREREREREREDIWVWIFFILKSISILIWWYKTIIIKSTFQVILLYNKTCVVVFHLIYIS